MLLPLPVENSDITELLDVPRADDVLSRCPDGVCITLPTADGRLELVDRGGTKSPFRRRFDTLSTAAGVSARTRDAFDIASSDTSMLLPLSAEKRVITETDSIEESFVASVSFRVSGFAACGGVSPIVGKRVLGKLRDGSGSCGGRPQASSLRSKFRWSLAKLISPSCWLKAGDF